MHERGQTAGCGEGESVGSQGRNTRTVLAAAVHAAVHATVHALTVREVKVMHMPPKPLKVRAMKIRTERSANNTDVILGVCVWGGVPPQNQTHGGTWRPLTVWFVGSVGDEETGQPETRAEKRRFR